MIVVNAISIHVCAAVICTTCVSVCSQEEMETGMTRGDGRVNVLHIIEKRETECIRFWPMSGSFL